MFTSIPVEVELRIIELRHEGLSVRAVALAVGVSPRTVQAYSPPARELLKVPSNTRHDFLAAAESPDEIEPIRFYPDDLPRLEPDPFGWTPAELKSAVAYVQTRLFPLPKDKNYAYSRKKAPTDQHRPTGGSVAWRRRHDGQAGARSQARLRAGLTSYQWRLGDGA